MNKTFTYKINKIEKTHDVVLLNIVPERGEIFDFKPGQFVILAIYDKKGNVWQQRPFSICSSTLNKEYLQLAIKVHSEFTKKITTLKIKDSVGVSGPYGFFTFNETKMKDIVFLAGGIGITPFMSAIRYVCEKKLSNKLTLLYSNKTKEDIVFFEELKSISQEYKNIQTIFVLTDDAPRLWEHEKGRIDKIMLNKYCSPFKEKHFLLCGPLGFMESLTAYLEAKDVSKNYIEMERFK